MYSVTAASSDAIVTGKCVSSDDPNQPPSEREGHGRLLDHFSMLSAPSMSWPTVCTALAVLRRISLVRAFADFLPLIILDETAATAAPAAMPSPTPFTMFMLCLYTVSNLQIHIAALIRNRRAVMYSFPLFTKTYPMKGLALLWF